MPGIYRMYRAQFLLLLHPDNCSCFNIMKRTAGIFYFIVAVFILLAHSVIPHHHHERIVCIQSDHCKNDQKHDRHQDEEGTHEHDQDNSRETCILKVDLNTPATGHRMALTPEKKATNFSSDYIAILGDPQFSGSLKPAPRGSPPCSAFSLPVGSVTGAPGLRAPPRS